MYVSNSTIPPLPRNRGNRGHYTQRQQIQSRNVKNINESDNQENGLPLEEEDEVDTVNPEPIIYVTEIMEDWIKINPTEITFENIENIKDINKTFPNGEVIMQTLIKNKTQLNCLADSGESL